jgi:hypothetical protein
MVRGALERFRSCPVVCAESGNRGWAMPQTYIIEVRSQAAGIVVRNPEGFVFFAASHRFNRLDGQLFRSAREAERAAARLAVTG